MATATTSEVVSAVSDEATIEAMTDTDVSNTGDVSLAEDVSQAEERSNDGQSDNKQSDNKRSNGKRSSGKRSKTLKLSKASKALNGARALTSEEKAVIIVKAEEIGAAEASREFGIN